MKYTFNKISIKIIKKGNCSICRKPCSKTKEFYQTINPYNLNKHGFQKTEKEIREEEIKKAERWEKEYVLVHNKCER